MDQKYYNIVNAAELLGVKVRTVRAWIRSGKINAIKYPNSVRWYISSEEISRMRGECADGNENREYS